MIDHFGVGHFVLLGIGVFDISNRAFGLRYAGGDALVTLRANADRPLDRGVFPNFRLPIRGDLRKVVCEIEGRARPVGTMHDCDRLAGQFDVGVQFGDSRIIPRRYRAEKNVGEESRRRLSSLRD